MPVFQLSKYQPGPPVSESPEVQKMPHKTLQTKRPPTFGDRAHGMLKLYMRPSEIIFACLRPIISDKADQSGGPTANPAHDRPGEYSDIERDVMILLGQVQAPSN